MIKLPNIHKSIIQKVTYGPIQDSGVSLFIKREDLIHEFVSGNKFRKLKYNIEYLKSKGFNKLITFGGAYSNHIAAVAAAGEIYGIETLGVIRGEELGDDLERTLQLNPTLCFASQKGMQFNFISRAKYREKDSLEFIEELKEKYSDAFIVPEGGTNDLAIKGTSEILDATTVDFDIITTAVGTGGTISGLIEGSRTNQKVLGFPALKADFLDKEIKKYTIKENWELVNDYHFGGYAKTNDDLIIFINQFKKETGIPLDPIYTGKMLFGLVDMIKSKEIKSGTRILAIHTGGLQGIQGMNDLLTKKKRITIN